MTSDIALELIWPNYEVGPHKIVFALGVISVNFARFERAITWMLAATTGCEETEAETILRPLPPAEKLRKLKTAIEGRCWPQPVDGLIGHFFDAALVLVGNRNTLLHSNMIPNVNETARLFRSGRKNLTPEQIQIDLPSVRQIADDFQRYWDFGLALANCIAVEINGAARSEGSLVYHDWPERPPFPFSLDGALP